jgi:very-short-patch-repair endonuclease
MELVDASIACIAAKQHGLITRTQAMAAGASEHMIRHRVRRGRWAVHRRGVLSISGSAETWEQRLMGACLATGAPASHRAAAALWYLPGIYRPCPELTVEHRRRVHLDGVRVHQSLDLDRIELDERSGIPCTPLDRTVLDLGAVLHPDVYGDTVREVIRIKMLSWLDLYEVLVRHARRGRDGCGRLRAVLEAEEGLTPTMSRFEHLLEQLLMSSDLPSPVRQHPALDHDGRLIGVIDLCYVGERVAIEADGRAFHQEEQFEVDRRRQNRLVLEGWTVLRFTWSMLVRQPWTIVDEVRQALNASKRRA